MDEDYGADEALLEAMAAAESSQPASRRVSQPQQKIHQPTPQRLDKTTLSNNSTGKIIQPTPQALPQRQLGSAILVSPRQRGNPVLACIRSIPWEYSDIPADYVLGTTTCVLFLSLKYHRLHPEYVYTRIRNLQGKYSLRVVLTMVDIANHEDSLRELSKTSVVNNVTIISCWSAAEAARYLELYKSYENASFTAIRGQQASSYADKLVEFVTVPRSLNKSDAIALVANFGSLKNAINAEPEQLSMMSGWGGVKVKRWSSATREPFRAKKAIKRGAAISGFVGGEGTSYAHTVVKTNRLEQPKPPSRTPQRDKPSRSAGSSNPLNEGDVRTPHIQSGEKATDQCQFLGDLDGIDDESHERRLSHAQQSSELGIQQKTSYETVRGTKDQDTLDDGITAALARLREDG